MTGPHTRTWRALAAIVAAAWLAGCSSQVTGAAVKDPMIEAGAVNPALLQPGNYPTSPGPVPTPSADFAAIVEGQRMADFVVGRFSCVAAADRWVITATSQQQVVDVTQQIAAQCQLLVGK